MSTSPKSAFNPLLKITPLERAMLAFTGLFVMGVVIYGFFPPGAVRSVGMIAFGAILVSTIFRWSNPPKRTSKKPLP